MSSECFSVTWVCPWWSHTSFVNFLIFYIYLFVYMMAYWRIIRCVCLDVVNQSQRGLGRACGGQTCGSGWGSEERLTALRRWRRGLNEKSKLRSRWGWGKATWVGGLRQFLWLCDLLWSHLNFTVDCTIHQLPRVEASFSLYGRERVD